MKSASQVTPEHLARRVGYQGIPLLRRIGTLKIQDSIQTNPTQQLFPPSRNSTPATSVTHLKFPLTPHLVVKEPPICTRGIKANQKPTGKKQESRDTFQASKSI